MTYDFDRIIDRRHSDSVKWRVFDEDVLPLWVADMDFATPAPVLRALGERLEHGVLGYGIEPAELRELFAARLDQLYGWRVAPEAVVFTPGVVAGFNIATRAVAQPGGGVLVQTPVYPPMLDVAANFGMTRDEMELTQGADGQYSVDFDRMAAAINDRTRIFMLCNPQNPTGRVFRRDELACMAELCLRRNVVICSDEIHCDLLFAGQQHVPIAALAPEVAAATITLMSPSKTFNIAGLFCSMAVIPNEDLRRAYQAAAKDIVPHINMLAFVAAQAAYAEGEPWLAACLRYLEANRDYLAETVAARLPGVRMARPEGTYLAWLDCREAGIEGSPAQFFLKEARVACNDGATFGQGGAGFVRLNFGCPRATLVEALERLGKALEARVDIGD